MAKQNKATVPLAAEPNLGQCLRALRHRHRWSLSDVAAKTGLATSTISRIENDQMSLTYERLLQLCRGLDIDFSELFAADHPAPPQLGIGRRAHTPPGEGRAMQANHYFYRYLCTEFANKKMTPIFGTITARSLSETGGFLRHEGEEMVYVLEGILEFHTEFYEPQHVETGGCIYFDSMMAHAFVSLGDGPAKILSVCSMRENDLVEAEKTRGQSPLAKERSDP